MKMDELVATEESQNQYSASSSDSKESSVSNALELVKEEYEDQPNKNLSVGFVTAKDPSLTDDRPNCADGAVGNVECELTGYRSPDHALVPYDHAEVKFTPFCKWLVNREFTSQARITPMMQGSICYYYACEPSLAMDDVYERQAANMKSYYKACSMAGVRLRTSRIKRGQLCVVCVVSDVAFDIVFKRGRVFDMHGWGIVDVECLDDLTFVSVPYTAVFELDCRFTQIPFRYAPIRFRCFKSTFKDVIENVEEARYHCISYIQSTLQEGHNLLSVGYDEETRQFIVDVVVEDEFKKYSLLSIALALYGFPYRSELEEEAFTLFGDFLKAKTRK